MTEPVAQSSDHDGSYGLDQLSVEELDRLGKSPVSTRLLATLLVISTVLVTCGLVLLWQQYQQITAQKEVIATQKAELDLAASELARQVNEIGQDSATNEGAISNAQAQAAIVEQQIRTNLPPGVITRAPLEIPENKVVLTRGRSDGWDIEVFWCENAAEQENFETARIVADALAATSATEKQLASGIRFGSVKISRWSKNFNPRKHAGLSVVSDRGDGEDEARDVVVALLNDDLNLRFTRVKSSGALTQNYLSVFACES